MLQSVLIVEVSLPELQHGFFYDSDVSVEIIRSFDALMRCGR